MLSNKNILLIIGGLLIVGAYMNKKQLVDMGAYLSKKWTKLHPEMQQKALNVLERAEQVFKDTPYTVHIFDGWRSIERQQKYMSGGTSFVSDALRSFHPWGLAVDFVFKDERGNWTWEPAKDCAFYDLTCHGTDWYWQQLGEIIESEGLAWGGRWRTFDGPHAQLEKFGKTNELAATYKTPEKFIEGIA